MSRRNKANTPYDDIFHIMVADCPNLTIPVLKVQEYDLREIFEKYQHLTQKGRTEELSRAAVDEKFRKKLYWEFGL